LVDTALPAFSGGEFVPLTSHATPVLLLCSQLFFCLALPWPGGSAPAAGAVWGDEDGGAVDAVRLLAADTLGRRRVPVLVVRRLIAVVGLLHNGGHEAALDAVHVAVCHLVTWVQLDDVGLRARLRRDGRQLDERLLQVG